jgi:hypothetical protein
MRLQYLFFPPMPAAMDKYILPPRADLANKVLVAFHLLAAAALLFLAERLSAGVVAQAALSLAVAVALLMRHPLVYGVVMVVSCLGIVASLHGYRMGPLAAALAQLLLAVYIRKHVLVLKADPAGDATAAAADRAD